MSSIPRKNRKSKPVPVEIKAGRIVQYVGKASTLSRHGFNVRLVAEGSLGHAVVEAIGRAGKPVRFTVKTKNLQPLQPDLFEAA